MSKLTFQIKVKGVIL